MALEWSPEGLLCHSQEEWAWAGASPPDLRPISCKTRVTGRGVFLVPPRDAPHRLLERQTASFTNGPLISRKHHLQKYPIFDPFLRMTNFLSRNAWFESRNFQLQNVPSPERFHLISRNPLSSSNIIELHKGQCPL